jgi:hypothetical protein
MFQEQDAKPWWNSKAQVGAVASTVSLVGAGFGLAVHPELIELALPIVAPIAVSLISNVVTIWGNTTRKQAIDTTKVLPEIKIGGKRIFRGFTIGGD